ncbi:MAG: hypothetical protein DRI86_15665 [Bacteroidetes bacterium]|nr:MAG: hypothetical protein DRI86_15665 [Bacteroidota bacterium]
MIMKYTHTFLLLLFFVKISHAQLNISTSATVANLIQNVLVGQGVVISNVTYTGAPNSIGEFSTGAVAGNLGFNNGIVLSTGNVIQLPGASSLLVDNNMNTASDPQLAALITQSINDAAVLEFDFVPVSDTIKFSYVFGSEEYEQYVGTPYNDVFGFFVSGLGYSGGFYNNVNIAIIPNTTNPVSINNINNGQSTNMASPGPCVNCNYYVNNSSGTFVKFNAFTTVLTAWIRVLPCFTYHIKIAIGDAADHALDSGVFLEANSFSSNSITLTQTTSSTIDSLAVEGCNDAILTFNLPYPFSTQTSINYIIGGTAINGVDYVQIPNSLVVPAGQDSVSLVISPIIDTLVEPLEYIELIVNTSYCSQDTVLIYIKDALPPLTNLFRDTTICMFSNLDIVSNTSGGYIPYSYLWSTGDTTASITITPSVSSTYSLVVSDVCNNDSTFVIDVGVSNPIFTFTGDSVCKGDTAVLRVNSSEIYNYIWSSGEQTSIISVSPSSDTQYTVSVTDSIGCEIVDSTTIKVFPIPIVSSTSDTIICSGDEAYLKVFGNYSVEWNTGSTNSFIKVKPQSDEEYSFFIRSSDQCENSDSINVEVVTKPIADIYTPETTVCIGKKIVLQGSGGDEYLWSSGVESPNMEVLLNNNAVYSLAVTNRSGGTTCSHDTSISIVVERCNYFYFASAFTPNGDGKNDTYGVDGQYEIVYKFDLYIYNRWGQQLFHATDPSERWDGTYEGKDASDGVYTYVVYIDEGYREPYSLKGTVTLYR